MKQPTLRKLFFIYSGVYILASALIPLCIFSAFLIGGKLNLYTFANYEERQVEALKQEVASTGELSVRQIPSNIQYLQLDNDKHVIASTLDPSDQQHILAHLESASIPSSSGYFMVVAYRDGMFVFKYHIGVRYTSEWANEHLPSLELMLLSLLIISLILITAIFTQALRRRIRRDLTPLQQSIVAIGKGDLSVPVMLPSLYEFKELGLLLDRMRVDLKHSLEEQWSHELQLKEETTQMLHDVRSPLTIARAHAEFLKEDLVRYASLYDSQSDSHNVQSLLKNTESIITSLNRLTMISDKLQQRMEDTQSSHNVIQTCLIGELNEIIFQEGALLAERYHATWESYGLDDKTEASLSANQTEIQQALLNIILNACEHGTTPQTVKVTFMLKEDEGHHPFACYIVVNTGSVFSQQALTQACQRGYSEKQSKDQIFSGLGLYFSSNVIKALGGQVILSNTPESCASVEIRLPLKSSSADLRES